MIMPTSFYEEKIRMVEKMLQKAQYPQILKERLELYYDLKSRAQGQTTLKGEMR